MHIAVIAILTLNTKIDYVLVTQNMLNDPVRSRQSRSSSSFGTGVDCMPAERPRGFQRKAFSTMSPTACLLDCGAFNPVYD